MFIGDDLLTEMNDDLVVENEETTPEMMGTTEENTDEKADENKEPTEDNDPYNDDIE